MGLLTEKFASRILANLAKQHGGIKQRINGGMRDGTVSWYSDRAVDLSTITDDMLDEPFQYETPDHKYNKLTPDQEYNMILFNDGWAVALKPYKYHKEHGTQEPNEKPRKDFNRYGTGIGDTGDHNRTPSLFVTDGGKIQGQHYDPYGVSYDSAESHALRKSMSYNNADKEYYAKEAEKYRAKAEQETDPAMRMMYQRREREARENERRVKNDIQGLKKRAQNLVKQHQPGSVTPIPLQESDIRTMVDETINRLIGQL